MPIHQRYSNTAAEIRTWIASSRFPPGSRLPNRPELARTLGVALGTLQRAVDELVTDGFLVARGVLGTFVAQVPPHLRRYGILTVPRREQPLPDAPWPTLLEAIWKEASVVGKGQGAEFVLYDGLFLREEAPAYRLLDADVAARRLGGLIVLQFAHDYMGFPVFSRPELPPTVRPSATGDRDVQMWPWCTPVQGHPHLKFIDDAVAFLAARRRRRLAVLAMWPSECWEHLRIAAARYGLANPDWHNHIMRAQNLSGANHTCQLLMMASDRPDALILGDDNLVPYATSGLKASVRYHPEDMDVVAWCNFPHPPQSHVPVHFMGPDIRENLRSWLDTIRYEQASRRQAPRQSVDRCASPPAPG